MELEEVMQTAKKLMLKYGSHPPTLIVETDEKLAMNVLDFFPDTTLEKKQLLFQIGHDLAMEQDIEAKDVTQLTWIAEAWFSQVKKEDYNPQKHGRPSQDPNRREGLLVMTLIIKDKKLTQTMQMAEVIRHGNILDLAPLGEKPDVVQSGFLTSALAGICAAALDEETLTELLREAMKDAIGQEPHG